MSMATITLLAQWASSVSAAPLPVASVRPQTVPLSTPISRLSTQPTANAAPAVGSSTLLLKQQDPGQAADRGRSQKRQVLIASTAEASIHADATLKVGQPQQSIPAASLPAATLYEYQRDGKEVVTVYLRDLPIVSFVEQPQGPRPLLKASALVARLNQMTQDPPANITLELAATKQDPPLIEYSIKANAQELLRIGRGTLLTNVTSTDAALLATNRLRRLLASAPPVSAPPLPPGLRPTPQPTLKAQADPVQTKQGARQEEGIASFYTFSPTDRYYTAAHRTLPFGTSVRVTNLENGRQTVVKINDRGPFLPGRVIDLSTTAARALGMIQAGIVRVRLEVLGR